MTDNCGYWARPCTHWLLADVRAAWAANGVSLEAADQAALREQLRAPDVQAWGATVGVVGGDTDPSSPRRV